MNARTTAKGFEKLAVLPRLRHPLNSELAPDPLEAQLVKVVHHSVLGMLDPVRILAIAQSMGVVQRERVHHVGLLVCALILSAFQRQTDTSGRWLDAQGVYRQLGGHEAGKTSFRNHARKSLPVLWELLQRQMKRLAASTDNEALRGRLQHFADILIPDGCAFKLANVLSGVFPGTGNASELKLHAVYSVGQGVASVTHSAGRVHDNDGFWPAWQAGALYIWDLGYNDMTRFIDASLGGAHVLQRLKSRASPAVTAWYDETGKRHELEPQDNRTVRLQQACEFLLPATGQLDLDVIVTDSQKRRCVARIVCVPFEGEDRYYLTSLPREIFTSSDCAELVRVRWEVELFFRNWHGALRMDDVHRLRHANSLQVAVVSSLWAACLGRDIYAGLEKLGALEPQPIEPQEPCQAAFPPRAAEARPAARQSKPRAVRPTADAQGPAVAGCREPISDLWL